MILGHMASIADRKGWRLPTVEELASLVDPTQSEPALPSGHPFDNVQSGYYWSSTTYEGDSTCAWFVGVNYGGVGYDYKTTSKYVWLVRGGTR